MRRALIAVPLSLMALPLLAQTQADSPLVQAAKAAAAVTKHTKTPVITNETLATTGGHMATAAEEPAAATAKDAAAKNTTSAVKLPTYAPGGINVTVGAQHLSQPPAPAYTHGSPGMVPDRPPMVSSQSIPTSPPATGLQTVGTYSPGSAGTYAPPMVSTTPMDQHVSKPPE